MNNSIIAQARLLFPEFQKILESSRPFEIKGILNSEILLFTSLLHLYDINHVIESGRARAQSTELIARWIRQETSSVEKFDSVEYDKNSQDAAVAEERLRPLCNFVNILYGDSFDLIPNLISNKTTAILIDGPKGAAAVRLACMLLRHSSVKLVCIHDIHKDDQYLRRIVEMWPDFCASDDLEFVGHFSSLDSSCWDEHQKYAEFKDWGPYKRRDVQMSSYGPTLVCLPKDNERDYECILLQMIKQVSKYERDKNLVKRVAALLPQRIRYNFFTSSVKRLFS